MTDTNIWPADLAELSASGPLNIHTTQRQFPAIVEKIAGDHDVVIQFSHEDSWYTRVNVYHRLSPNKWLALDAEDGAGDSTYETEALPVLMFRDRMTGFITLSIAGDGKPAARDELATVPRGSIAVVDGSDWPTILCALHGEWVDLHRGIEESWKTDSLLKHHDDVRLLWVAPGAHTPKPPRLLYTVYDEVLVDGRAGYIICGGQGAYGVQFAMGTPEVKYDVPVADIEYVATTERPLSREDASARKLDRCNACGDYGAGWMEDQRPDCSPLLNGCPTIAPDTKQINTLGCVAHDPEVDASYWVLSDGVVASTLHVYSGVNLDLDAAGGVVGIEVLHA